mmetsp:Transcript_42891/g.103330  ORF Transcript_42891/g.103330 Transcript_42891/m.103330 type:complete len:253 (+) Transcript_42891:435-1193(+)
MPSVNSSRSKLQSGRFRSAFCFFNSRSSFRPALPTAKLFFLSIISKASRSDPNLATRKSRRRLSSVRKSAEESCSIHTNSDIEMTPEQSRSKNRQHTARSSWVPGKPSLRTWVQTSLKLRPPLPSLSMRRKAARMLWKRMAKKSRSRSTHPRAYVEVNRSNDMNSGKAMRPSRLTLSRQTKIPRAFSCHPAPSTATSNWGSPNSPVPSLSKALKASGKLPNFRWTNLRNLSISATVASPPYDFRLVKSFFVT